MSNIQIRRATAEDAESLLNLRAASIMTLCAGHYPQPVLTAWANVHVSAQFLRQLSGHFYVAEWHGHIVGSGMIDLTSGWIDAIFVSPELACHGIGRSMLTYLEALALQTPVQALQLESTLNAATFYQHMGFSGLPACSPILPGNHGLACIPMHKKL